MMRVTTPQEVRRALILRQEHVLIDLRPEADFATAHPLFAAQMPLNRIAGEAGVRIPRLDTPVILYDDHQGLIDQAAKTFRTLGYTDVSTLAGDLNGWAESGGELFEDVNSYSKAFGELVEARRHTPSLPAQEVQDLISNDADMVILDARRFDEYQTMSIPTGMSVPGAELVLQARALAPDPATKIIVNCAGRTRSLIGAQSLINAGIPNPVAALRNGTIGWLLAGQTLAHGQGERAEGPGVTEAREQARDVAYRAGVKRLALGDLDVVISDTERTLYRFDVRQPAQYEAGHIKGFRNAPGGQLVQETDSFAPVRGGRIVLSDDAGVRADMTASWLAQMGWEVYVLDGGFDAELAVGADPNEPSARGPEGKYRRPYEGVQNSEKAMQAYLDWEFGLVEQLSKDGTHGFYVI